MVTEENSDGDDSDAMSLASYGAVRLSSSEAEESDSAMSISP
jgi:hypothetical protein